MIDLNNAGRAEYARYALDSFCRKARRELIYEATPEEKLEAIQDLVCDLLHLARKINLTYHSRATPETLHANALAVFNKEESEDPD